MKQEPSRIELATPRQWQFIWAARNVVMLTWMYARPLLERKPPVACKAHVRHGAYPLWCAVP